MNDGDPPELISLPGAPRPREHGGGGIVARRGSFATRGRFERRGGRYRSRGLTEKEYVIPLVVTPRTSPFTL